MHSGNVKPFNDSSLFTISDVEITACKSMDISNSRYPVTVNVEAFDRLSDQYLNICSVSGGQLEYICVTRFAIGYHFVRVGKHVSCYSYLNEEITKLEVIVYLAAAIPFFEEIKSLYKDKVIWEGFRDDTLTNLEELVEKITKQYQQMIASYRYSEMLNKSIHKTYENFNIDAYRKFYNLENPSKKEYDEIHASLRIQNTKEPEPR